MASMLDLPSRHPLAFRLALETPTPGCARANGVQRKRLSARIAAVRGSVADDSSSSSQELQCPCCCARWGRRSFLAGAAPLTLISTALPNGSSAEPNHSSTSVSDPLVFGASEVVGCPRRPGWYKELFAKAMDSGMQSYEAEIAWVKGGLFSLLSREQSTGTRNVLEIGVGTGPNLKYYAGADVHVYGVDPNEMMEKYSRRAAADSGLGSASFSFVQGFAEALPVRNSSMDAVIGTLVMCSVSDVSVALKEVKRVLKPGGCYAFIEHVAAQDGSFLRLLAKRTQSSPAAGGRWMPP